MNGDGFAAKLFRGGFGPDLGAAAEYCTENWEQMTHRLEIGSVTWDDEHAALAQDDRAALALPDRQQEVERIIERNRPDEPAKGGSRG
jgi:hypothetical protein